MRIAYADPPYPGQAKRHYGNHADYAGEVDHTELIRCLERDYPDGWALSTGAKMLQDVLAICPPVRVLSLAQARRALRGWFPVVLRAGSVAGLSDVPKALGKPPIVKWAVPVGGTLMTFRPRPDSHVHGTQAIGVLSLAIRCDGAAARRRVCRPVPRLGCCGRSMASMASTGEFGMSATETAKGRPGRAPSRRALPRPRVAAGPAQLHVRRAWRRRHHRGAARRPHRGQVARAPQRAGDDGRREGGREANRPSLPRPSAESRRVARDHRPRRPLRPLRAFGGVMSWQVLHADAVEAMRELRVMA